ncbi:ABC transporter ATP-binding protein [Nocardia jinanensis]|uniref:ABC transporter domain-containing protein n=1 Tax=Nocardia jinanensis TaxID=382504 RepID=A0A917RAQ3_9NOCA|nr:ABC transporter ATP-binding protein [Nocardia jinanensis]GGK99067.1 hypothetical protein GCM10011588_12110 [Nocardia jinanensis]
MTATIRAEAGGSVPDEHAPPVVAELSSVRKSYHGTEVLGGIDLTIRRGDRLAVVGESGSGKSTLARILLGLVFADQGSVKTLGVDWKTLRPKGQRALRGRIGVVFQQPVEALSPRLTVAQILAEPLSTHRRELGRQEISARAAGALDQVHMPRALLTRRPGELSGGQAQRIALARALILEPELLVMDEPTSALDPSVQAQMLALFSEVADRGGLSWMFVTHDLGVAVDVCDRIAVVRRGHIVEEGPGRQTLDDPQHPYTRELVGASFHLHDDENEKEHG